MNKMRENAAVLCCSALFLLWACSSNPTSADNPVIINDFTDIAQQLESAYQQGSQSTLDSVFISWQRNISPFSPNQINALSDTIKHVYDVFRAFYTPHDLNRITGGQHEDFETDFRYIAAQNSLHYAVVDSNPQYYYYQGVNAIEMSILDFRPTVNDPILPVVYLSALADSMIYHYLYQNNGTPQEDHQQRLVFLRQAMQLTHHHWISDYHKVTMPVVSHIYLNEMFTQALVTFRVFYQFGQAYLERSENNWNLIHSELTAIE